MKKVRVCRSSGWGEGRGGQRRREGTESSRRPRPVPKDVYLAGTSRKGGARRQEEAQHHLERAAKIMSQRGLASRRESERLMQDGKVMVDGQVHRDPGRKIDVGAEITIVKEEQPTAILHKPMGITPAWELLRAENQFVPEGRGPAPDGAMTRAVVKEPWHMAVVGRLDKESRGLLLMTQDGVLARRVIGTKDVWKRYVVEVDRDASAEQVKRLNGSMNLDGVKLKRMVVKQDAEDKKVLGFELREGRKHQIRRCCSKVGLKVVDLFRTRIGPWDVEGLPEGKWRLLTRQEVDLLS
ncbi:pseudouridine synthase [Chloropicon primus]|nr:pseudouridine synthase [Chloropicon primus]